MTHPRGSMDKLCVLGLVAALGLVAGCGSTAAEDQTAAPSTAIVQDVALRAPASTMSTAHGTRRDRPPINLQQITVAATTDVVAVTIRTYRPLTDQMLTARSCGLITIQWPRPRVTVTVTVVDGRLTASSSGATDPGDLRVVRNDARTLTLFLPRAAFGQRDPSGTEWAVWSEGGDACPPLAVPTDLVSHLGDTTSR